MKHTLANRLMAMLLVVVMVLSCLPGAVISALAIAAYSPNSDLSGSRFALSYTVSLRASAHTGVAIRSPYAKCTE